MLGLMQQRGLMVSSLITHAALYHGGREIVSRTNEGPVHRTTWHTVAARSRRLAQALARRSVQPGERIATLAWNGYRHLELYFGVTGGGVVLHTVNPRLFPEQIEYIINHGQATHLFFDLSFADLVAQLAPRLPAIRGFVAMTDRAHMPAIPVAPLLCYEDLVEAESGDYAWPDFDENSAATLCYTSGTTGNPKGVLYSHRSTVLHAFAITAADGLALAARDAVLLIVPLFHVNAWGLPFAAAMCGAKLVMPGPKMDGASVWQLLTEERCTFAAGIPTIWLMFLEYVEANRATLDLRAVVLTRLLVGGSAAPRAMIEKFDVLFGAFLIHGWGMSEMSPLGTVGALLPAHDGISRAERYTVQEKQGRVVYGVELKIVGADGHELPRDGHAFGDVKVRGPWIAQRYFGNEGGEILDADGWFATGDVATVSADGYLRLVDRSKDVIKSGGEWISSIAIENAALGYPGVLEAAVVGIAHPKWQERPLLLLRCEPGATIARDAVLAYLAQHFAKWWLPDDVLVVPELPHTATGKLLKTRLRDIYSRHYEV